MYKVFASVCISNTEPVCGTDLKSFTLRDIYILCKVFYLFSTLLEVLPVCGIIITIKYDPLIDLVHFQNFWHILY